ncbi:DUF4249 domain-containing protein [Sinomicrobium weinanense]|uniref:DUF4249 domain-containing protein n=1 Tax=Sinomicrobium weinanense TaxID=2842200 RepID=A0A926JQ08_9FLAO|nr:DUF4249 domain-containing protein [Sinomicrobium weinanense]MBC9795345.1 DUF4249 domain-containing protein [Sinomicrobium weinanense]MBU3122940.1 DUF4249 domain-containing protein [Sinomicrobium weinanense]
MSITIKRILPCLMSIIALLGCEDTVHVDVPEATPRLVIDASINLPKDGLPEAQQIKLTTSAPYYNDQVPPATGASVEITDSEGIVYTFLEDGNSGIYKNTQLVPKFGKSYTLDIVYQNEHYTATETMKSVTEIEDILQSKGGGFSGNDYDIKAYYTDPRDEDNFYLFEFIPNIQLIPNLQVYEDEYTQGNRIFAYYTDEDLAQGNQITIRVYGVSERFYNFMNILLEQSSSQGNPFQTQPATVKGNCVNLTDKNNFPFGYFRLSEMHEVIYTLE